MNDPIVEALNRLTAAVESLRDARVGLVELQLSHQDTRIQVPAGEVTRIEAHGESYHMVWTRRHDGRPDSYHVVTNGPAVIERMNFLVTGGIKP